MIDDRQLAELAIVAVTAGEAAYDKWLDQLSPGEFAALIRSSLARLRAEPDPPTRPTDDHLAALNNAAFADVMARVADLLEEMNER